MCDACLQLGSPWLPALHAGEAPPRPRPRAQFTLARRKVKPLTKAAAEAAKPVKRKA